MILLKVLSAADAMSLRTPDTVFPCTDKLPVSRIMLNVFNDMPEGSRLYVCVSRCYWIKQYSQPCIYFARATFLTIHSCYFLLFYKLPFTNPSKTDLYMTIINDTNTLLWHNPRYSAVDLTILLCEACSGPEQFEWPWGATHAFSNVGDSVICSPITEP